MSVIRTFEDMKVWQDARKLVSEVYRITERSPLDRDYGFRDQIRKSSVSVMANIAEGFERNGNREFIQFLSNAKGPIGELRSHLYVAVDLGIINRGEHEVFSRQVLAISRQLSGMIKYLAKSHSRGSKFRNRTQR